MGSEKESQQNERGGEGRLGHSRVLSRRTQRDQLTVPEQDEDEDQKGGGRTRQSSFSLGWWEAPW